MPSVPLPEWLSSTDFRNFVEGALEILLSDEEFHKHDLGYRHVDKKSLQGFERTCLSFCTSAKHLLLIAVDQPGYDWQRAGHDFAYTSNGEGVGFWDRDELPEDVQTGLTERCQNKSLEMYMNDQKTRLYLYRGYDDYRSEHEKRRDAALNEAVVLRNLAEKTTGLELPLPVVKPRL